MKWLLLDDPNEHGSSMHENISAGLNLYGQDVDIALTLDKAISLMNSAVFDYVMIHHNDFTKVDTLRGKFPNPKLLC